MPTGAETRPGRCEVSRMGLLETVAGAARDRELWRCPRCLGHHAVISSQSCCRMPATSGCTSLAHL